MLYRRNHLFQSRLICFQFCLSCTRPSKTAATVSEPISAELNRVPLAELAQRQTFVRFQSTASYNMAEENRNMIKTYGLPLQYSSEITYSSSGLDSVNVTENIVLKARYNIGSYLYKKTIKR